MPKLPASNSLASLAGRLPPHPSVLLQRPLELVPPPPSFPSHLSQAGPPLLGQRAYPSLPHSSLPWDLAAPLHPDGHPAGPPLQLQANYSPQYEPNYNGPPVAGLPLQLQLQANYSPQYEPSYNGPPVHSLLPSPTQGHGSTRQLLPSSGQLDHGPAAVPLDHPHTQLPYPGQFLPPPAQAAPPTQLLKPTGRQASPPVHSLLPSPTQGHGSTQQLLPTSDQFLPPPAQAAPPTQLLKPTANHSVVVAVKQGVQVEDEENVLGSIPGLVQVGAHTPLSLKVAAHLLQNPTTWLSDNKVNFPSQLLFDIRPGLQVMGTGP